MGGSVSIDGDRVALPLTVGMLCLDSEGEIGVLVIARAGEVCREKRTECWLVNRNVSRVAGQQVVLAGDIVNDVLILPCGRHVPRQNVGVLVVIFSSQCDVSCGKFDCDLVWAFASRVETVI